MNARDKFAGSTTISSRVSNDVTWQASKVSVDDRVRLLQQQPATVWLTGLSGAGKSTIAYELERRLIARGQAAFVMDGDNVRHGLNRDLGFSPSDRSENIRRIAEVAKLFNEAGMLVITSFISPYCSDRAMAREIIGADRFIEVHLATELRVCEERDPKGLYRKVRAGEIREFTGISAPYETPGQPDLRIDTGCMTLDASVEAILGLLESRLGAEPHE
ncbi:adenylyl-sulfate kinase [Noviherbaspirillum sp. Root189]|uniref:adenylyl-sulfate kinase n=1 Tax=Noviherbaspirillum sp. Root189 TaxID=1736487 RepID=UPI00070C485D|nr:adenylyl-sulfate kinase [Noviherbaspirillum sp. Root189]KRB87910.1 adenylyl-sulfate kinase [Noviherbaspirillum sp. Root189]